MNPEDATQRTLEVVVSEKVFSRLKTQMLLVYGVSFALASIIAWSLTWQYRALSDLASSRISEYQLLVADGLHELHKLDLDEVAMRTRPAAGCAEPLPADDAEVTLTRELGHLPEPAELRALVKRAQSFGVCDIGEVEHLFEDAENMAKVDTVYRLLAGPPRGSRRAIHLRLLAGQRHRRRGGSPRHHDLTRVRAAEKAEHRIVT